MNYYEYRGKMASTSQVPIFSFTLALIVPLLAILAHVRKAPQLFAIAVTAAFIVVSNIGFYAHFYHSLMSKGGSQWLNTVMAAAVLQMSGVVRSQYKKASNAHFKRCFRVFVTFISYRIPKTDSF